MVSRSSWVCFKVLWSFEGAGTYWGSVDRRVFVNFLGWRQPAPCPKVPNEIVTPIRLQEVSRLSFGHVVPLPFHQVPSCLNSAEYAHDFLYFIIFFRCVIVMLAAGLMYVFRPHVFEPSIAVATLECKFSLCHTRFFCCDRYMFSAKHMLRESFWR